MARVAFIAHCLLNQNAKVEGGAKRPAMWEPVIDLLRERGYTIRQMPCPELAFGGARRFWGVREQFDTPLYRRHCRRLAKLVAAVMAPHLSAGDEVVLIGDQGSERVTAEEVGAHMGTIGYEVVTAISERVPREHRGAASDAEAAS